MSAVEYEVVIGLEVHAQLLTESKAFCACANRYGDPPNTHVCPVCLGLPGSLPVLNAGAVERAVRAALAFGCEVHRESVFARKNYFYPDLPKGYQISQYERPLATGGAVPIEVQGEVRAVRLTRIHMEEDAGKNLHGADGLSRVDFNRAGTPLVEIVSEPDMRSAEEAMAYLRSLRQVLRWLDVCDGNMEEGSLRCDINVSIRPRGESRLGTRAEVKNVNSIRFVGKAIQFEVERQAALLARGEGVRQETRTFDSAKGETVFMRAKEKADDYRYFPEPDLPPLRLEEAFVGRVAETVRELPLAMARRLQEELGLSPYDAGVLTAERDVAAFFSAAVQAAGPARAKKVANWMMGEVLRRLNEEGRPLSEAKMTPALLAELVVLADGGQVTGPAAKRVFDEVWKGGERPEAVLDRLGLRPVSDDAAIDAAIRAAFARHPEELARLRGGEEKLLGFFMGQAMRETRGKGDPKSLNARIRALLAAD